MAQATMTVRTDAALKATFNSLCEQFGMSANTAINIFMRAVAETRSIPFVIGKRGDTEDEHLLKLMEENRQYRIKNSLPELYLDEINAEIGAYRAEHTAKNKTQAL
ncbi:MAG: type II toxin-antitoxin system RelB/DinJ family antitoxin [Paludibacteraceae bacterium]|nr:type II toxin-antitoxin system RelB/DinJ family antitoxin [Paludibacteraceae bacterium]